MWEAEAPSWTAIGMPDATQWVPDGQWEALGELQDVKQSVFLGDAFVGA
jgi:hypothetical protein